MKKRSIKISGHDTSISLENEFWCALKQIAAQRKISVNMLITQIDEQGYAENLSSAVRLFILKDLQGRIVASAENHSKSP